MSRKPKPENEIPTCCKVAPEKTDKDEILARYHLVIFQQGEDFIERGLVAHIQDRLDDIITTPPEQTQIDVWLDSPGGSADAAYKLVLDLRGRSVKINTVIPDFAKSAATLLALGTDCIYMSAAAELGPLDVQLGHPDREGVRISGLDITDSLEFLGRTAIGLTITGGASLIKYTGLSRHEILHEMLQFMAQFMQPTVSKLDPHLLHQAFSQLRVADEYAIRMLRMRNVKDEKHMDDGAIDSLLNRLVNAYPTHGFVIDRTEAAGLGLPIENMENYDRWDKVRLYRNFSYQENRTVIAVCPDSELDMNNMEAETNGVQQSDRTTENEGNDESTQTDS